MRRLHVHHLITKLELGGAQQNTLFCCGHHDRTRYAVSLGFGPGGVLDEEAERLTDVDLHRFPRLKREVRPSDDAAFLAEFAVFLRKRRVDVLHTHSSKAGILGRFAAALARVPVVVHTVHGWGFHDFQRAPVRAAYVLLERAAARTTDRLIAVSVENRDRGLAEGIGTGSLYRVIRSGIDAREFGAPTRPRAETRRSLGLPEDARVVLTVGNFKPQKAPLDFIRMAAEVRRHSRDAWFVMAGDGELLEASGRLARELGVADRIVFAGWRRDVPDLLHAADVFALTSLFEGLPRSVLQAQAAGLPVIATRAGGTPEAVQEGISGHILAPRDVSGFASRVVELLTDPDRARAMGEAGKARLGREFDIRVMLGQVEDVYRDLAALKGLD